MVKNRYILFCISLLLISFKSEWTDEITKAFKSGLAENVANYFYSTVEIDFPENKGVFSKTQSEQILNNFFKKNSVTNFTILHQGESKDGKYLMANLNTGSGAFRIYCYLKKNQNNFLIKELRIEK